MIRAALTAIAILTATPVIADAVPPPAGFNLETTLGLTRGCSEPIGNPADTACGFYVVGAAHALSYAKLACFPDGISNREINQAVAAEARKPWIGAQAPDWGVPGAILSLWGCTIAPIAGDGR